jgi:hypothetical protein
MSLNLDNKRFLDLNKEIAKALRLLCHQGAQLSKVVHIFPDIISTTEQIQKVLWNNLGKKIAKAITSTNLLPQKAVYLGKMGWTIPGTATIGEYEAIISQIKDILSADKAFTSYYFENDWYQLKTLKNELLRSATLKFWEPAIEEAFLDFDDGRYRSCTALLLPLVEGIMLHRFPNSEDMNKFLAKKVKSAKLPINRCMWLSLKSFTDTLFKTGCKTTPRIINRHWLLHGRDIPSSNLSDCLRLFQALERIAYLR